MDTVVGIPHMKHTTEEDDITDEAVKVDLLVGKIQDPFSKRCPLRICK